MFKTIIFSCLMASSLAQFVDPKSAKILKEQRFNAGDGRAGSAFATEDGLVFREETDKSGNRIGEYSYVGADGKTYNVKYSAGIDGFRILNGDHIKATGAEAAPFNPNFASEEPQQPQQAPLRPRPQAQPLRPRPQAQAFRPPPPQPQAFRPQPPQPQPFRPQAVQNQIFNPQAQTFAGTQQQQPAGNPFINPFDPTHSDFSLNQNGARFDTRTGSLTPSSLVPNCADCQGLNPFVNPFDASHSQQAQTIFDPTRTTTTPPTPSRVFPPGELKLKRFETGFNFDFQS